MKRISTLTMILVLWASCLFAQEKPKTIVETIYLLPKRGMSEKFEAAVKAHNDKFHKEGPHYAALRTVEYGDKAGWYVWLMRGTYASLDSRPDGGDHSGDWDKTIDPLVEKYGRVGLFEYNEELSYGADILMKSKYYRAWQVDIKDGKYEQFKSLVSRVKKSYESMGNRAFLVYDNAVPTANTADVGMLWSFDKYDELDDNWGTKDAYEKLYGEGSWAGLIDEWQAITNSIDVEIRSMN